MVAIVTGGSSGIGLCAAKKLTEFGCTVYEFSRREFFCEGIVHMSVDVSKEKAVSEAVAEIIALEGKIDIVINCAGYGISGAAEFTLLEDAKRQLDVNFFGMVNVNKAVIPYMRRAGGGRIVNISSVAAVTAIPFQAYYSASKAAINSYTCALANEVYPYGISVTAVMPGDIKTGFTSSRKKSWAGDSEYGGRISRSVAVMEHDEENGMSPEKAGGFIAKIALKKIVKPLYTIGFSYRCVILLTKILPCALLNCIIRKIYAK